MSRPPVRFDVFRAGMIGGAPLGRYVATIEAPDHRTAKDATAEMYGSAYVVLPAGRTDRDPTPHRR